MQRLTNLKRAAEDAQAVVSIAYSPFEVMRRSCLNTGARKAAEVAVVNVVERAILAQAVYADALAAHQQSESAKIRSQGFLIGDTHCARPIVHLTPGQLETTHASDVFHSQLVRLRLQHKEA